MADTFGGLTIPVPTTDDPVGDPAIGKLLGYSQAVLNAYVGDAWRELRPRTGNEGLPVKNTFSDDPHLRSFNEKDLPALFMWRRSGKPMQWAEDMRVNEGVIRALWVFPPEPQAKQSPRTPFSSAIAHALDMVFQRGRDPSWFDTGDTEVTAISHAADTDSIKTTIATATTTQTYSGAALNGAVGGAVMAPRRQPTVTTTVEVAPTYNVTDAIVWTYVDWHGDTVTTSKKLTLTLGGETIGPPIEAKQIVSVALPAQLLTTGAFEFGTAAVVGRGSVLTTRAGLMKCELTEWQPVKLDIQVLDADDRVESTKHYAAIQFDIAIQERHRFDLTDATRFPPADGLDLTVTKDGFVASVAALPDNGV